MQKEELTMRLNQYGETVRLAVIGLGCRGISQMKTLLDMPDVDVTAVCDVYEDRTEAGAALVREIRGHSPFRTLVAEEAIDRPDVDAAVIMTSWETSRSSRSVWLRMFSLHLLFPCSSSTSRLDRMMAPGVFRS